MRRVLRAVCDTSALETVWLLDHTKNLREIKNFRLLWPCIMNVGWRERETNKMQLIWCLLSNFYLNMFRASSWPSTVHTARVPAPHNHSHHNQCRTTYAAVHTLVLLMMGIMMPETCWDKSLIINIRLVASCWFFSLHPRLRIVILHWSDQIRGLTWLEFICISWSPLGK